MIKWFFCEDDARYFNPREHFYDEKGIREEFSAYEPSIQIYDVTQFLKEMLENDNLSDDLKVRIKSLNRSIFQRLTDISVKNS